MKIITTPYAIKDLEILHNADAFIVGNSQFAVRLVHSFSLMEIQNMILEGHLLGKEVYVSVNKIFVQNELEELKEYLNTVENYSPDGYVFADLGVLNIAKEMNITAKMIYNPETLIVNYQDMNFYLSLGIKAVIISKEVTLENILLCGKKAVGNVGILGHGYYHLFYSKRKLIKNYFDYYQEDGRPYISNYAMFVKEHTRPDMFHIYQDDNGTSIMSAAALSSIDYIHEIKDSGISFILIDGIFENIDYLTTIVDSYYAVLHKKQNIKTNYFELMYPDHKYDTGYFFKKIGIRK